jgi:hypothetical protein
MTSQGAEGPLIRTFDEFVDAAAAHFSYNKRELPFPSREAGTQGLRRWWGEQVELEVVGPGSYRWRCPGRSNVVETQGDDVHTWEPFDYVLWEHCPTCSGELAGSTT